MNYNSQFTINDTPNNNLNLGLNDIINPIEYLEDSISDESVNNHIYSLEIDEFGLDRLTNTLYKIYFFSDESPRLIVSDDEEENNNVEGEYNHVEGQFQNDAFLGIENVDENDNNVDLNNDNVDQSQENVPEETQGQNYDTVQETQYQNCNYRKIQIKDENHVEDYYQRFYPHEMQYQRYYREMKLQELNQRDDKKKVIQNEKNIQEDHYENGNYRKIPIKNISHLEMKFQNICEDYQRDKYSNDNKLEELRRIREKLNKPLPIQRVNGYNVNIKPKEEEEEKPKSKPKKFRKNKSGASCYSIKLLLYSL